MENLFSIVFSKTNECVFFLYFPLWIQKNFVSLRMFLSFFSKNVSKFFFSRNLFVYLQSKH